MRKQVSISELLPFLTQRRVKLYLGSQEQRQKTCVGPQGLVTGQSAVCTHSPQFVCFRFTCRSNRMSSDLGRVVQVDTLPSTSVLRGHQTPEGGLPRDEGGSEEMNRVLVHLYPVTVPIINILVFPEQRCWELIYTNPGGRVRESRDILALSLGPCEM